MYLITNRSLCSRERYLEVVLEASRCGVGNVIIREKDLPDDELESLYIDIKKSLGSTDTNFIINSNLNLFEKLDFEGLHLPFIKFLELLKSGYNFNKIIDNKKILGLSLHSLDEIKKLNQILDKTKLNIGYVTLSHIFETDCKKGLEPKGLRLLKDSRKITDLKIVALGGILPTNVGEVMEYSDDFAVMSTVMKSKNVQKVVQEYNSNLKNLI